MRPGSATKRKIEGDQDPDYDDAPSTASPSKKSRTTHEEDAARELTIKKIEAIIKKQFAVEAKQKEREIELIDERIHQVRVMLDKLRACVVASYYGNIRSNAQSEKSKPSKVDMNHPAIKRVTKQMATPSSQANTIDKKTTNEERCTPDSEILSRINTESGEIEAVKTTQEPQKQDDAVKVLPQREGFRYDVRKRIIVGNVSKYISADQREDSDPSTHKWMVYVRGPPNEPSIGHFVKKVWFFLHPSYRPNDLVEVKEPPFHLTRRGWGEFPIRIQLHFVDPRNKKVDIIHQIKLDRTYTGLQTLGAETIVDVELDRYLTDDNGLSEFSRPASPAITNVNYREGSKPQVPHLSVSGPNTPSQSTVSTPVRPRSVSLPVSPEVSKARKEALDKLVDDLSSDAYLESSITNLVTSSSGKSSSKQEKESITTEPCKVSPERKKDILAVSMETDVSNVIVGGPSADNKVLSSLQSTSITRAMPPLGPITSGLRVSSTVRSDRIADKPDTILLEPQTSSESGDLSPGAVNVAEIALKTSPPGKMAIRIQHGKVVPSAEDGSKEDAKVNISPTSTVSTSVTSAGIKTSTASTSSQVMKQMAKSLESDTSVSSLPTTSGAQPLSQISTSDTKLTTTEKPAIVTAVKKIQGTSQSKKGSTQVGIPQPPPGTQYYITATSSDPNLQGKVILIPQQVFSQTSTQQKTTASKVAGHVPINKNPQTTITKPGTPGKKAAGGTKGPFLSPSNVLILPQGSIVPPLPSGSIVQIQQVPTQANKATVVQTKQKSPSVPAKGTSPKQPAPKLQAVNRSTTPPTSLIKVQRAPKTSAIQNQALVKTQGVSLLPDQKGQLVRTQSGGVVLVQRSSGSRQQGTSGMTQVKIAHHIPILTQKVSTSSVSSATSTKTMVTVGQSVLPSTGQSIVIAAPKPVASSQSETQVAKVISSKGVSLITGQIGVVKESGVIRSTLPSTKKVQETSNVVKLQGLTIVGGKSCLPSITGSQEIVKATSPVDVKKTGTLAVSSDGIAGTSSSTTITPSKKDSSGLTSIGASTMKIASGTKQDFLKKFIITPVKQEPRLLNQQIVHHVLSQQNQFQSAPALAPPASKSRELKSSVRSEKTLEIPPKKGIDLKEIPSMENLVKAVVKRIPMINGTSDPTIFPFCATSLEQFESWHIIKRKACEWQRAVAIKENVKKLISDAKNSSFSLKDVWTTKQLMIWCRCHGYMPYVKDKTSQVDWCDICGEVKKVIDEEGRDQTEEHSNSRCKERWLSEFGFLKMSSYTTPDVLRTRLENKKKESSSTYHDTDDSDIDIISVVEPLETIIKSEPSGELLKPKLYMPPSEGATLIEEMCQQIGIKLKQVEVCEDVFAPASQEMLFNAAKQFMSDLVRCSLAEAYKSRSDCRPPQEILPNDIYKAVTSSSRFELLTNKHLGVQTRSGRVKEEKDEDE